MSIVETIRSALEAIWGHRLRSALTVLGILIGIAAVILTVGLGEGASATVNSAISSLGTNLLIVTPGSSSSGGVQGGFGSASTLTYADAQDLASRTVCPNIVAVAPTATTFDNVVAGSKNWTTQIDGTTASWLKVRDRTMAEGSFFTPSQVDDADAVAVIGSSTAQELGLGEFALGQVITVNNVSLSVIGVLNTAGDSSGIDEDDMVLVPITLAQSLITGSQSVQSIYVEAQSQGTLGAAYGETDDELLALHQITNPAKADFTITSQSTLESTANSVNDALTFLLAGIAAISLLVGGIGVMNIMLVSVTERVREIGLRKALGATPAAIRRQFLFEASALGLTGGFLGAGLGVLGAVVIPQFVSNHITLEWWALAGSIGVAMAIGLGFGVYPAARAARLAPIDALRSE
ncbi:MAG TPA: ABC transporter permease [Acidimicrobiales bacterium]|nr:ABC transporter permease [Acidimicrobiales bacterium]